MNTTIEHGKITETKGMYQGNVTSIKKTMTKSLKIKDMYDLQSNLLEYSKYLINEGVSGDVSFHIIADTQSKKPKRIEVTWITEKTIIPVNAGIEKAQ